MPSQEEAVFGVGKGRVGINGTVRMVDTARGGATVGMLFVPAMALSHNVFETIIPLVRFLAFRGWLVYSVIYISIALPFSGFPVFGFSNFRHV